MTLTPEAVRGWEFSQGAGCIECNGTGYFGRLAVSELLDLSDPIREMILDKRPASEIKRLAASEGMTFLRDSALLKVAEGVTTIELLAKLLAADCADITHAAIVSIACLTARRLVRLDVPV